MRHATEPNVRFAAYSVYMTSQQAESYTSLAEILSQENGVTLRPAETAVIRAAADALFFADDSSLDARDDAQTVLDALTDSERWSEDRAASLAAVLDACGRVAVTA